MVNDSHFQIWKDWGVNAWPTLAIVDPAGNVVTERSGEGFYPEFKETISSLVGKFGAEGLLDRRPLKLKLEKQGLPQTVLSFPGKVRVDAKGGRLFIADTDHNRIVVAALDSGKVLAVIGSGRKGFRDGDFATAEFNRPQGVALSGAGDTLYIADTNNHALRAADLAGRTVTTLDGTGAQASAYPPAPARRPVWRQFTLGSGERRQRPLHRHGRVSPDLEDGPGEQAHRAVRGNGRRGLHRRAAR